MENNNAYWCINDKNGFINCSQRNVGQVTLESSLGNYIYQYASNPDYKTFLEIGTWNGMGSTKCFIEGFKSRIEKNYIFYSLECNLEKNKIAKNLYKDELNVHILSEVLLREIPSDINELFPELISDSNSKYWNEIDFSNMKDKPLFLERTDLPTIFDVILLDGGEFSTYYEYKLLEDKCRILMLDDTRVSKCKKIVEDIKNKPDKWSILVDSSERSGYMICENVKLK